MPSFGWPSSVPVRDRIWSVAPDVPITRTAVMTDLMAEDVAGQRYRARLMAVFAGLAALFAMMGIYGVTARSVARRTQEMGIRVALATNSSTLRADQSSDAYIQAQIPLKHYPWPLRSVSDFLLLPCCPSEIPSSAFGENEDFKF